MADHPIHRAAYTGDLKAVQELVEKDPSLLHRQDHSRRTPLIDAADKGYLEVVRYLLDAGAGIDHLDRHGYPALHWACIKDQREVVALLLDRGADVSLRGSDGRPPIMVASHQGHVCVLDLLLRHGGSDVDAVTGAGETALYEACSSGHAQVARLLLEAGADPFITDNDDFTPMQVAEANEQQECVKLLQEWSRSYDVCRARRIRDASTRLKHAHAQQVLQDVDAGDAGVDVDEEAVARAAKRRRTAVPEFLKVRVGVGGELPLVVTRPQAASNDEGDGRLNGEVLGHAMDGLKGELFVELAEVIG